MLGASAEHFTESEHLIEDVASVWEAVGIEASAGGGGNALVAEAIKGRALLRIAQNAVSLGSFLEFFFGVVIAGVAVGMMLQSKLPIGSLEHLVVTVPGYTEDFIIVALGYTHRSISLGLDCHFDHGRAEQATFEVVTALEFRQYGVIGNVLGFHHFDGVMDMRIKRLSLSNNRL